jgi:predicted metal-dependent phosphoesterase TrpH
MHTTASDGTDTPAELIRKAARRGLHTVAITDHDTTAALAEALSTAATLPSAPRIIPGIELSTDHGSTSIHLLGYNMAWDTDAFQTELASILDQRDARNREMVDLLNRHLGLDITMEEIRRETTGNVVARPHFARVLVNRGIVQDLPEAFERLIGDGKPCYVERERFETRDAIEFVHRHGGVAVIAHPCLIKVRQNGQTVEDVISELVAAGVDGLEAHYSLNTPSQTAQFVGLSRRYRILATGGSDYHGRNKTDIALGSGRAEAPLAMPAALADELLARR